MAAPASTRRVVRERAQRRCEYCHADERWQCVRFTIGHILPQAAGGLILLTIWLWLAVTATNGAAIASKVVIQKQQPLSHCSIHVASNGRTTSSGMSLGYASSGVHLQDVRLS